MLDSEEVEGVLVTYERELPGGPARSGLRGPASGPRGIAARLRGFLDAA